MATDYVTIEGLHQSYGDVLVFQNFSLRVGKGEFVTLIGPNACGKTTLLRLLSGELRDEPALGVRVKGGIKVNGLPVGEVRRSMIYQRYTDMLLPWRTAYRNIAFPLELRRLKGDAIPNRIKGFFSDMGISLRGAEGDIGNWTIAIGKREVPLGRYPHELSGGQQQMIALLTALIHEPKLLLLDEPFSSLDQQNSLWIQETISALSSRSHLTAIMATHNLDEALFMSDRIVFLTEKPAHIRKDVRVELAKPRTVEVVGDPEYAQLKRQIISLFKEVMET